MNRRGRVFFSMIVGFCGGIFAPYVSGRLVGAQEPRQTEKVVTAQKFVLVNEQGTSAGIFGFDEHGSPEITLLDAQGKIIWSTKLRAQMLSH